MDDTLGTLSREILDRGIDDIIQLAEVISVAIFDLEIPRGAPLFEAVEECYRELVSNHFAVVGQIDWTKGPDGFPLGMQPWVGDGNTIARRVIREWKALGHDPNLNEVCWIELTNEGLREGLELRGSP